MIKQNIFCNFPTDLLSHDVFLNKIKNRFVLQVEVEEAEETHWSKKYCQAQDDPHFLTFDRRYFFLGYKKYRCYDELKMFSPFIIIYTFFSVIAALMTSIKKVFL